MISKRELLIKMNISYGQLYRWKRTGLIPDSWFIKQSVSTGQETFFDEELIIPRIEQILSLKDKYQFEEMKDIFSDDKDKDYDFKDALNLDSIDPYFLKIYLKKRKQITITELAFLYLLTKYNNLIDSIDYLNIDFTNYPKDSKFLIIQQNDVNSLLIVNDNVYIDNNLKIIVEENITNIINQLASEL